MQDSAGHQPLTDLERGRRTIHALREAQAEVRTLRRDNADLVKAKRELYGVQLLESEVRKLRRDLHRMQHSKSWRITRWLRVIEPMIRRRHQ